MCMCMAYGWLAYTMLRAIYFAGVLVCLVLTRANACMHVLCFTHHANLYMQEINHSANILSRHADPRGGTTEGTQTEHYMGDVSTETQQ